MHHYSKVKMIVPLVSKAGTCICDCYSSIKFFNILVLLRQKTHKVGKQAAAECKSVALWKLHRRQSNKVQLKFLNLH